MDMWDTDLSGGLSVSEFVYGVNTLTSLSESILACAHATYDANGDGELQLEELAALISADNPLAGCGSPFSFSYSHGYGSFSFSYSDGTCILLPSN